MTISKRVSGKRQERPSLGDPVIEINSHGSFVLAVDKTLSTLSVRSDVVRLFYLSTMANTACSTTRIDVMIFTSDAQSNMFCQEDVFLRQMNQVSVVAQRLAPPTTGLALFKAKELSVSRESLLVNV